MLDAKVVEYSRANNIDNIENLKKDKNINSQLQQLESHLTYLSKLGYIQMPLDMQEVVLNGFKGENAAQFIKKDKNPSPFTTIDVPEEDNQYLDLSSGIFQEVFEPKEIETYGHFTFNTKNNELIKIDTQMVNNQIIDPVAFAYDLGARMYDARLGRMLSVDKKFKLAPDWSPYRFGMDNPILIIDPDGNFEIPIHKQITETAAKQQKLTAKQVADLSKGVQNADYYGFHKDYHFDGRKNFTEILQTWIDVTKNIKSRGDDYYNLGFDLHTVQDFYAHSNYVELYIQYYKKQGGDMAEFSEDNVPLFEEGIKDKTFLKDYLIPNLRTGDFDLTNNEKIPWTDKDKLGEHSHHEMNKDSNESKHGGEKIPGTKSTYHDVAKGVAEKATKKVLTDKNKSDEK